MCSKWGEIHVSIWSHLWKGKKTGSVYVFFFFSSFVEWICDLSIRCGDSGSHTLLQRLENWQEMVRGSTEPRTITAEWSDSNSCEWKVWSEQSPKNNECCFHWRKGVQWRKECVQHCMKTIKETAKNKVVDILFPETILLFLEDEAALKISTYSPPPPRLIHPQHCVHDNGHRGESTALTAVFPQGIASRAPTTGNVSEQRGQHVSMACSQMPCGVMLTPLPPVEHGWSIHLSTPLCECTAQGTCYPIFLSAT